MKHLVFIITQGWVQYRLNNQQGSHPMGDDSAQQVIDYLKRIIPHDTTETIFGWRIMVELGTSLNCLPIKNYANASPQSRKKK